MKRIIIPISIVTMLLSVCGYTQNRINDSISLKIKKKMTELQKKSNAPSIVLALVHDQEIIFSNTLGYSDLENKIPATIDTKYAIASVTKTFTATMLMKLTEDGILGLHDDVRKYVPEYNVKSNIGEKCQTSLFQLATHTAGLPRNSHADIDMSTSMNRWFLTGGKEEITWFPSNDKILESVSDMKLDYPPFHYLWYSDRHYSNLGYNILGIALERASEKSFENYVNENICKPLKMTNTGFINTSDLEAELAPAYWKNPKTNSLLKSPFFIANSAMYAGGMYSTARDLTKYISSQFQNNTSNKNSILDETSKEMMRTLKIGWKPAYPFVHHRGHWSTGIQSSVYFHPELKVGWVILSNSSDFDIKELNKFLKKTIKSNFTNNHSANLQQYIGTYELEGSLSMIKIYLKNNRLYSTYLNDLLPDNPLVSDGDKRFIVKGDFDHIIDYDFETDNSGKVKMFRMGQLSWYKK